MDISFKDKVYFSIIFFIGVLLRVTWILGVQCKLVSDFKTYQEIATNIFMNKGHTYLGQPVAFQGMGYPVVLGWFYKLVGTNDIFYGKLLNVILSSVTLIFILAILVKLVNDKRTVYLVFTITAILPNYVAYNNVIGTENLAALLMVLVIFLQVSKFNKVIRYVLIGILVGALSLVKPNFLVYPVVMAVIEWMREKNVKEVAALFICSVIFMCIIVAPWTYRNYKKFNLFIPVSYNGGYVLFINNNSNNVNGAWMPIGKVKVSDEVKKNMAACGLKHGSSLSMESKQVLFNPKLEKVLKGEAKRWISAHPMSFCRLGLIRVKNTFFKGAGDIQEWTMHGADNNLVFVRFMKSYCIRILLDSFIKLISAVSIIYLLLNSKKIISSIFNKDKKVDYRLSIPVVNIAFFLAISFVFEGQPRYDYPILFLLIFCTVEFVNSFMEKHSTHNIKNKFSFRTNQ